MNHIDKTELTICLNPTLCNDLELLALMQRDPIGQTLSVEKMCAEIIESYVASKRFELVSIGSTRDVDHNVPLSELQKYVERQREAKKKVGPHKKPSLQGHRAECDCADCYAFQISDTEEWNGL